MLFFQIFNEALFILTCIAVIASVIVQFAASMRRRRQQKHESERSI